MPSSYSKPNGPDSLMTSSELLLSFQFHNRVATVSRYSSKVRCVLGTQVGNLRPVAAQSTGDRWMTGGGEEISSKLMPTIKTKASATLSSSSQSSCSRHSQLRRPKSGGSGARNRLVAQEPNTVPMAFED
ncbi:hypothetical protein Nepgr_014257 [Nepenthes gracilis]|uniref:Uncharacterized protein n=1 Tax=Nepenthes gracilis TaxID=150966 RepID=A0AAD3SLG0_NEPGR|nr:hypothetical protein Nepgr_014257 [Nepenthes gracilis]